MANKQWTNLISEEALDAQIAKAQQAAETAEQTEPRTRAIAYDSQQDAIVIYLKTDVFIGIPRKFLQGLENATAEDLQDFWLTSNGDAVHWERLNASFSIPGLVSEHSPISPTSCLIVTGATISLLTYFARSMRRSPPIGTLHPQ